MSVLIIDPIQQKERLARVDESIQHYVQESEQAKIDNFLDSIISLKARFVSTTAAARAVEEELRSLFQLSNVSDEQLIQMNAQFTRMEEQTARMRNIYIRARRFFEEHKLAKASLRAYGDATNDLKEVLADLRLRFFTLPEDQEFQDLFRQLNEIA